MTSAVEALHLLVKKVEHLQPKIDALTAQALDLSRQLEAKDAELQSVKAELTTRVRDNEAAQHQEEQLRQQLEAKDAELQSVKAELTTRVRDNEAAQHQEEQLRQQLEAKDAELSKRQQEEGELKELRQQMDAKSFELENLISQESDALVRGKTDALAAKEASELAMLQLGQMQQELEHYYLLSRRQAEMLSSSEKLSERGAALIAKMMQ